jgi:predicted MPP superfamily phosphohydrolase
LGGFVPRILKIILFIITLIFLTALAWGVLVEPRRVVVRHVEVEKSSLAGVFAGKRVVVISDLHLTGKTRAEGQLLSILNDLSPDYLFLLGDYVRWNGNYEPAFDFLSRLEATQGVYGVLGDYDHQNSRQSCLFCHEPRCGTATTRHSVHLLMNSETLLQGEHGAFRLVGLDSAEGAETRVSGDGIPTLVLGHDPLLFDGLTGEEGVLMLAGDTHGGQIPLPAFVWTLLGYEKNARYNHGWFAKGKNKLYVTRGVGTSHLPLRFLCPPEVVVLTFD